VRAKLGLPLLLVLAACASAPKPVDPPLLKAALEAESDGAKRYQRGDLMVAERRFADAMRRFASIDDASGSARNRLHLVRVKLAQGQVDAALELLDGMPPALARDLDVLLLRGQALLASDRAIDAERALELAAGRCGADCAAAASLEILRGRASLRRGEAAAARAHAERGLALLRERDEPHELGNAWRLLAAARLAAGDVTALAAAQAALDIDRRLALPEKIARDWLLLGDIHRRFTPGQPPGGNDARLAYARALEVAEAAGLKEISLIASQALQAIGM
jgi:tetratricopeptide (TPR) repeat protein